MLQAKLRRGLGVFVRAILAARMPGIGLFRLVLSAWWGSLIRRSPTGGEKSVHALTPFLVRSLRKSAEYGERREGREVGAGMS